MATPYTLRLIQANGSTREIVLGGKAVDTSVPIAIGPNTKIELLNAKTGQAPARIRGKKLGNDLLLNLDGQDTPIRISDYYGQNAQLVGRNAQGQWIDYLPRKTSSSAPPPPVSTETWPSIEALEKPSSNSSWSDALTTQNHEPLYFQKSLVPTPFDPVGLMTSPGGLTALGVLGTAGTVAYSQNKTTSTKTPASPTPSTPTSPTPDSTSPSPTTPSPTTPSPTTPSPTTPSPTTPSPTSPSPNPSPPPSGSGTKPVLKLSTDSGTSTSDGLTNSSLLSVTAPNGSTISYSLNGATFGNYVAPTVDGVYTVIARASSSSGSADSSPLVFTLDRQIKIPTLSLVSDTGISSSDRITTQGAFTSAPVDTDTSVRYTVNGQAADQNYVASVDGVYTVMANASDTAGNTSSSLLIFTRDTSATAAPLSKPTLALSTDSGTSSSDRLTNKALLALTGSDTGATVSYSINGSVFGAYVTPTLDKVYTVVAKSTLAGATQTSDALVFTLDTTQAAPALSLFNDGGTSNSDNISRTTALNNIPSEAGTTYSYTINGSDTIGGQPAGLNFIASTDGVYTIIARAVDAAGNTGTNQLIYTRDTSIATPTLALTSDTGSNTSDRISRDGSIKVLGLSSEVGSTISYTVNGTTVANFTGASSDGVYTVVATQRDVAGNSASSTPFIFTRDTQTTKPVISLMSDTGTSTSDRITRDERIRIAGTETGSKLQYSLNGSTFTDYTAEGYNNEVINGSTAEKRVIIRSTDTAGNTATSDEFVYTFSTVSPANSGPSSNTALDLQLDENTPASTALYNLASGLGQSDTTTFRLSGKDANQFTLNDQHQLLLKNIADFEAPRDDNADNTYDVRLERWDDGQLVAERDIHLNIQNKTELGDQSLDLGTYGKLIAPVQVNGKWFYFWDVNSNGQADSTGDTLSHDYLDTLFNQDLSGNSNPNADTDTNFRYATLAGMRLALPTIGDSEDVWSAQNQQARRSSHLEATPDGVDPSYHDLAAIWDANNSSATGAGDSGLPEVWRNLSANANPHYNFRSASQAPAADNKGTMQHALFTPDQGLVWSADSAVRPSGLSALDAQELSKHYVVLEVLSV